jgi:hypothetical protein
MRNEILLSIRELSLGRVPFLPVMLADPNLNPHFHFELYLRTVGRSSSSMVIQV